MSGQYRKTASWKFFLVLEKVRTKKWKPPTWRKKTRCVDGHAFYDRINAITEDEICAWLLRTFDIFAFYSAIQVLLVASRNMYHYQRNQVCGGQRLFQNICFTFYLNVSKANSEPARVEGCLQEVYTSQEVQSRKKMMVWNMNRKWILWQSLDAAKYALNW